MEQILHHATCVAVDGKGILLRGPSGSGKSDLALRVIERGGLLVADDQVFLSSQNGLVRATAPVELAGRMEVRGVGILTVRHVPASLLHLVCDLVTAEQVPRLPPVERVELLPGCHVVRLALYPFEASAVAKLCHGLAAATEPDGPSATRAADPAGSPSGP